MSKTDHHFDVLASALQDLLAAAFAIDGALDGVTDQFDDEVASLQAAMSRASRVLKAIDRTTDQPMRGLSQR